MKRVAKQLTEVYIVMGSKLDGTDKEIIFVEAERLSAERDIEEYCKDYTMNPNKMVWIQIERLHAEGLVFYEAWSDQI